MKMRLIGLLVGLLLAPSALMAQSASVLLEDSFDGGVMSPEWVSKLASQWVEDGWLHSKDTDGWPRDSMAVVHDSDPSWRDYKLSLSADFVEGTPWEDFTILLRSDDFLRGSEGGGGRAYQLTFRGSVGWGGAAPSISLIRSDLDSGTHQLLFDEEWPVESHPMFIEVSLTGGRIQMTLDEQIVFEVVDPDPLLFGGIGVHAIWESEARFDSFRVTAIPIPAALWLFLSGLGLVGFMGRRMGDRADRTA